MKKKLYVSAIILCISVGVKPLMAQNAIDSLKPGYWYEIPNSHMADSVEADPTGEWIGGTGPVSLMSAWSGGAFDSKRNRLMIWGGGHYDYWGNALYAFDVNTLDWHRLTNNSSMKGWRDSITVTGKDTTVQVECHSTMPDGLPVARHTYGGLTYVPDPIDRLWANGGACIKCGFVDSLTWEFNFTNNTWQRKANEQLFPGPGNICAYDPVTQTVILQTGGQFLLQVYNLSKDTWVINNNTGTGNPNPWCPYGGFTYYATGAVDPDSHHFVAIGGGGTYDWDMNSSNSWCYTTPRSQGDTTVTDSLNPGFVWDAAAHLFVGWAGGANVWTVDPKTWTWKKNLPASGNTVIPTNPPPTGTYGRFQYIPSKNAFIAVNSINQNVYAYKLDNLKGITTGTNKLNSPDPDFITKVYPNPLQLLTHNNGLTITVSETNFIIEITNLMGQEINRMKSNGSNVILWNGKDLNGNNVSAGIYVYRIVASGGQLVQTGKISVIE